MYNASNLCTPSKVISKPDFLDDGECKLRQRRLWCVERSGRDISIATLSAFSLFVPPCSSTVSPIRKKVRLRSGSW